MLASCFILIHDILKRQLSFDSVCTSFTLSSFDPLQDKCKKFADKYIEHDFVVLFIDIILIKPQVYRHLLYNRLGTPDDRLNVFPMHKTFLCLAIDTTPWTVADSFRCISYMGSSWKVSVKLCSSTSSKQHCLSFRTLVYFVHRETVYPSRIRSYKTAVRRKSIDTTVFILSYSLCSGNCSSTFLNSMGGEMASRVFKVTLCCPVRI